MYNESKSCTIKLYVDSEIFVVYVRSLIAVEFEKTRKIDKYNGIMRPYSSRSSTSSVTPTRKKNIREITFDLAPFSTQQKPPGADALSKDSHTVFHECIV